MIEIDDTLNEIIDKEAFSAVVLTISTLVASSDLQWKNMVTALLASSAYAAREAGLTAEEFLDILSRVDIENINEINRHIGNC